MSSSELLVSEAPTVGTMGFVGAKLKAGMCWEPAWLGNDTMGFKFGENLDGS